MKINWKLSAGMFCFFTAGVIFVMTMLLTITWSAAIALTLPKYPTLKWLDFTLIFFLGFIFHEIMLCSVGYKLIKESIMVKENG